MNRKEIVRFLNLSITRGYGIFSLQRIFFEVSVSKIPALAPESWAEKYHLDCVLLESQRKSSATPFQTHCIEIKSCKADFKSDTKWKNYIGRTDRLSFLALPNVIDPNDLPDGIGLIVPHRESGFLYLETIKKSKLQKVSIEARYDTMYGIAINKPRHEQNNEIEEHKKLIEKYFPVGEFAKSRLAQGILDI